jgi:hypothetical protein
MPTVKYVKGSAGGSWGGFKAHAVPSDYQRPNHGDGRDRIHWANARCGVRVQVHTPLSNPPSFDPTKSRLENCQRCVSLLTSDMIADPEGREWEYDGPSEAKDMDWDEDPEGS